MTTPAEATGRDRAGRLPSVMADHPGWWLDGEGRWRRLLRAPGAVWLAVATPHPGGGREIVLELVEGRPATEPEVDIVDPAALPDTGSGLRAALLAAGPVARIRTSDLWEALVGAILRCTTAPERARELYGKASRGLGHGHDTAFGRDWRFPTPAVVVQLAPDVFDSYGLGEVRDRLRTAAWVVRAIKAGWHSVPWDSLAVILAPVPRLGSAITGAAIADLSGDFRFLPADDVLVISRVRAMDPAGSWPEAAAAFGTRWLAMVGTERSAWTVLALAVDTRPWPPYRGWPRPTGALPQPDSDDTRKGVEAR